MNTKFLVIRFLVTIAVASSFFVSCDDDISDVGGNALIGSELTISEESNFTVTSDQIDITQPQTNNLDYYLIGDNDHGFGNTNYGILTQLNSYSELIQESYSEITNDDDELVSTTDVDYELTDINLVIPFRYNLEDDDDVIDDNSETQQYNIASKISGDNLTINVYESDYILQTTNPNDLSGGVQKYYGDRSDGINEFGDDFIKNSANLIVSNYEVALPDTGDAFTVDLFYDEDDDGDEDDAFSEEGVSNQFLAIRIPLENFRESILEIITAEGASEDENGNSVDIIDFSRITEDNFTTDIFKGLYIETTSENGIAEVLDFDQSFVNAGIQMVFTKTTTFNDLDGDDDENENTDPKDDVEVTTEQVISTLQFSGAPINILTKTSVSEELPEIDNSQEEIILQSGLGRIGTIDLFNDEELETLHGDDILLNDAVLRLTINTSLMDDFNLTNDDLPENIFIYELETGNILADYTANNLLTDDDNENLKEGHLMTLVTSDNGEFEPYYEINITEHLSNILRQNEDDSDDSIDANTTLALSVTEDLDITLASDIYNPDEEQFLNQGSLLCFKTVPLYGSEHGGNTPNEDDINKRPRLTIKFTPTN